MFGIACGITCVALFSLGVAKSFVTKQRWWKSGLEVFVLGGGCAAIAYIVGALVEGAVHSS